MVSAFVISRSPVQIRTSAPAQTSVSGNSGSWLRYRHPSLDRRLHQSVLPHHRQRRVRGEPALEVVLEIRPGDRGEIPGEVGERWGEPEARALEDGEGQPFIGHLRAGDAGGFVVARPAQRLRLDGRRGQLFEEPVELAQPAGADRARAAYRWAASTPGNAATTRPRASSCAPLWPALLSVRPAASCRGPLPRAGRRGTGGARRPCRAPERPRPRDVPVIEPESGEAVPGRVGQE